LIINEQLETSNLHSALRITIHKDGEQEPRYRREDRAMPSKFRSLNDDDEVDKLTKYRSLGGIARFSR